MMTPDNGDLLRSMFNAIPSAVFVMEEDLRIVDCNAAAAELLPEGRDAAITHRGGEALRCLHALDVPEGCGRGPHCRTCKVRNSVNAAFTGKKVARCHARMELIRGGETREIHALVTATPFVFQNKSLVVLVVEDISELLELRRIIPICAVCKKIRDDSNYWNMVETYLARHLDVGFSHGLCPDCFAAEVKKLMEEE